MTDKISERFTKDPTCSSGKAKRRTKKEIEEDNNQGKVDQKRESGPKDMSKYVCRLLISTTKPEGLNENVKIDSNLIEESDYEEESLNFSGGDEGLDLDSEDE